MAEFRAAEDALRRIYLTSTMNIDGNPEDAKAFSLPSDTLVKPQAPYTPRPVGDDEVNHESKGLRRFAPPMHDVSPFRPNGQPMVRSNRKPTGSYKHKRTVPIDS